MSGTLQDFGGFTVEPRTEQTKLKTTLLTLKPGATIPPHFHERKEKAYYLISGYCIVTLTGKALGNDISMTQGSSLYIQPGVVHSIKNNPDKKTVLLVAMTEPFDDVVWVDEKPTLIGVPTRL